MKLNKAFETFGLNLSLDRQFKIGKNPCDAEESRVNTVKQLVSNDKFVMNYRFPAIILVICLIQLWDIFKQAFSSNQIKESFDSTQAREENFSSTQAREENKFFSPEKNRAL